MAAIFQVFVALRSLYGEYTKMRIYSTALHQIFSRSFASMNTLTQLATLAFHFKILSTTFPNTAHQQRPIGRHLATRGTIFFSHLLGIVERRTSTRAAAI